MQKGTVPGKHGSGRQKWRGWGAGGKGLLLWNSDSLQPDFTNSNFEVSSIYKIFPKKVDNALIQVKCLSCFPTESWSLFLHVSFTFKSQQWNHLTTILWNLFSLYAFANQIKSSIPFAKYMSFRNNTIIAWTLKDIYPQESIWWGWTVRYCSWLSSIKLIKFTCIQ